jgi:hypothetical protein
VRTGVIVKNCLNTVLVVRGPARNRIRQGEQLPTEFSGQVNALEDDGKHEGGIMIISMIIKSSKNSNHQSLTGNHFGCCPEMHLCDLPQSFLSVFFHEFSGDGFDRRRDSLGEGNFEIFALAV